MYSFVKMNEDDIYSTEELIQRFSTKKNSRSFSFSKLFLVLILGCMIAIPTVSINKINNAAADIETEDFSLISAPLAAVSSNKNLIAVPAGIVKANPFLPYRSLGDEIKVPTLVNDVPKFDLIEPPDFAEENSEVAKIMDTVVSGILFDKYSPSAILNIEGNDYLVKKGDTVHNYKILNIAQNSVTVQLGKNTYQAGIGEVLSDGKINHNDISNLNKKFGGDRR